MELAERFRATAKEHYPSKDWRKRQCFWLRTRHWANEIASLPRRILPLFVGSDRNERLTPFATAKFFSSLLNLFVGPKVCFNLHQLLSFFDIIVDSVSDRLFRLAGSISRRCCGNCRLRKHPSYLDLRKRFSLFIRQCWRRLADVFFCEMISMLPTNQNMRVALATTHFHNAPRRSYMPLTAVKGWWCGQIFKLPIILP